MGDKNGYEVYKDWKSRTELQDILNKPEVQNVLCNVGFCVAAQTLNGVYSLRKSLFHGGFPVQLPSSDFLEVGSSFTWNEELFKRAFRGDVNLFFHFPFWGSIFREHDDFLYLRMISYLKDFKAFCKSLRIPSRIVMHPGYPLESSNGESMFPVARTLSDIEGIGLDCFMLENMAGQKDMPKYFCGLKHIGDLIDRSGTSTKICFDTEHLYAMGEDYTGQCKDKIALIHLNSIPSYVDKGRNYDRHSYSFLRDTKEPQFIQACIRDFYGRVPMVLERLSIDIMVDDLSTIAEWKGAGLIGHG